MKRHLFLLCLFLYVSAFLLGEISSDLDKGKILPKVICRNNPENSYALYLPPAYTPEKKWPILYALDPGARGHVPVELFRQAAEKYNYILVGSNNCKNGPWPEVIQSMIVLWNETNDRFAIDKNRIYVTGFSGGSRAASIFSKVIMHPVAGIIGCGAGLAKSLIKPEQISPTYYLGIVGQKDFNYREMMMLCDQFEQKNVAHRFLVHPGGHAWPTEDICQRAIEWMEVIGMQKDTRVLDKSFIVTVFQKEKKKAIELEDAGRLSQSLSRYKMLADTFGNWLDIGAIRTKIQTINNSEDYTNDLKIEEQIQELEIQNLRKFGQAFAWIEKNPPPVQNVDSFLAKLELDQLKAMAADSQSDEKNFMAIRLLQGLEIDAGSKGWDFFQKKDFTKAIFFFEIAASGGDSDSQRKKNIYYNLACAYAQIQNKKRALENLKLALEHGFDDIELIKKDEDLAFLHDNEEFQKLIKKQS